MPRRSLSTTQQSGDAGRWRDHRHGGTVRPPGVVTTFPRRRPAASARSSPLAASPRSATAPCRQSFPRAAPHRADRCHRPRQYRFRRHQGLTGANTWLILDLDSGTATGSIFVKNLDVNRVAASGSTSLSGSIGGYTGPAAAGAAGISPSPNSNFRFNSCPIHLSQLRPADDAGHSDGQPAQRHLRRHAVQSERRGRPAAAHRLRPGLLIMRATILPPAAAAGPDAAAGVRRSRRRMRIFAARRPPPSRRRRCPSARTRWARTAPSRPARRQSADVFCGTWQQPSARVRAGGAGTAGELAQLATDSPWRTGIDNRYQLRGAGRDHDPWQPADGAAELHAAARRLGACRDGGAGERHCLVRRRRAAGRTGDGALHRRAGRRRARRHGAANSGADALLASRLAAKAFSSGDVGQFDTLMAVGTRANLADNPGAAESAFRAALALQQKALGKDNPNTSTALMSLALQLSNEGRYRRGRCAVRRCQQAGAGFGGRHCAGAPAALSWA